MNERECPHCHQTRGRFYFIWSDEMAEMMCEFCDEVVQTWYKKPSKTLPYLSRKKV